MNTSRNSHSRRAKQDFWDEWTAEEIARVCLFAALIIAVAGYLDQHAVFSLGRLIDDLIRDFYANASTELASISLTVLVIDKLNERRHDKFVKAQLIRELRNADHLTSKHAFGEMDGRNWFCDGSLRGADLAGANLKGIRIFSADLEEVNLAYANLEGANLQSEPGANLYNAKLLNANLKNANLRGADLSNADFTGAILDGVDLANANLSGAQSNSGVPDFSKAKSLSGATMPDGSRHG
jgi:uncharacterized protein YjbI with pentapeptide repeats